MRGDIVHGHFCSWAMRPLASLLKYKPPQQASGLFKCLTGWAPGSALAKCSLLWPRRRGESRSLWFTYIQNRLKTLALKIETLCVSPERNSGLGWHQCLQDNATAFFEHYNNSYVLIKVMHYVLCIYAINLDRYRTCTLYIITFSTEACNQFWMGHCGWIRK